MRHCSPRGPRFLRRCLVRPSEPAAREAVIPDDPRNNISGGRGQRIINLTATEEPPLDHAGGRVTGVRNGEAQKV